MRRKRPCSNDRSYRGKSARIKRRMERKGMTLIAFVIIWILVSAAALVSIAAFANNSEREKPNLAASAPNAGHNPAMEAPYSDNGEELQTPVITPAATCTPTPKITGEHWSEPSQTELERSYANYREEVPIGALCEMLMSGDGRHIHSVLHPKHLSKLIQKVELLVVLAGGEDAAIEIVMEGYKAGVERELGRVDKIEYEIAKKTQLNSAQIEKMKAALEKYNISESIEAAFRLDIKLALHGEIKTKEKAVSMRVFKVSGMWYLYPEDFSMSIIAD